MATQRKTKSASQSKAKLAFAAVQHNAKAACGKGAVLANNLGGFTKGNVEALTESGKILGAGLKTLGSEYAVQTKAAASVISADLKELGAVRSPADFFEFQKKILRRNLGVAFAFGSKSSDALLKLTKEAAVPLSHRLNAAADAIGTKA